MNLKLKPGMLFVKSSEKKCVKSLSVLKFLKLGCNPLPGVRVHHWINNYTILIWVFDVFMCTHTHTHTVLFGRLGRVATICREACPTYYIVSHHV
jgi:hypothetical protein